MRDPYVLNVINLDKTESIHTNYSKYLLGLSETCSNIAVRLKQGSAKLCSGISAKSVT